MATRNIVPNTDNAGAIGLDAKRWAFGHFQVLKQAGKTVATIDQIPSAPGQIGAAAVGHTHTASNVTDFNSAVVAAVVAALNAGTLTLTLRDTNGSTFSLGVDPYGVLFTTKQ